MNVGQVGLCWMAAVGCALGTGATQAMAARDWNVADGNWDVAENWAENAVPDSGQVVWIRNSGTAHIANGMSAAAASMLMGQGGNSGNLDMSGGTLTLGDYFDVGYQNTGTFRLSGGAVNCARAFVGELGSAGAMTQEGGNVTATGDGSVGSWGGHGIWTQSGGANGFAGTIYLGEALGTSGAGTGTWNLSGADSVVSAHAITVAYASQGTWQMTDGTVTVATAVTVGQSAQGEWHMAGGEVSAQGTIVGYNGRGTWTMTDGTVTNRYMYVGANNGSTGTWSQAGGSVRIGDWGIQIGRNGGSVGRIELTGTGAVFSTPSAYIGYEGWGTLSVTQGEATIGNADVGRSSTGVGRIEVGGGGALIANEIFVASSSGSTGVVVQTDGSIVVNGQLSYARLSGAHAFHVMSGGTLTVTNSWMEIARESGGTCDFTQTGGAVTAKHVRVADWGVGTYTLSGGTVTANEIQMGTDGSPPGSSGVFNMGRDAVVTAGDLIVVAGRGTVNFGTEPCEMNVKQSNYSIADANSDMAAGRITGSPLVRTVQIGGADYTQLYIQALGTVLVIR